MMKTPLVFAALLEIGFSAQTFGGERWPQFRGPDGSGLAEKGKPPVEFGPGKRLVWKVELPPGHSSPVIWDDRIFLTAFEDGKLETICLNRIDGKIIWKEAAPAKEVEKVHAVNSPASPTPATDGQRVYVYFGSFGLLAYDMNGKALWQHPIPTPKSTWGTAASPIVLDGKVILVSDSNNGDSILLALDAKTGEQKWNVDRKGVNSGWCTPYVWRHGGKTELVVGSNGRLISYDPLKGEQLWQISGMFRDPIPMPVGNEELLFYVSPGVGSSDTKLPTWAEFAAEFDADHDGKVQAKEIPKGAGFVMRPEVPKSTPGNVFQYSFVFGALDANHDGALDEAEWTPMAGFVKNQPRGLYALKAGISGEAGPSAVAWKDDKGLPEIPSPVLHDGIIYLLRDGGMLTAYTAKSGSVLYDRERIGVAGQYCASPIIAGDHLYAASERGVVNVLKVGEKFEVLAKNDLSENIYATPAVAGNNLYVRTKAHLWSFGE